MKFSDLMHLKNIYLDKIYEPRDNHLRLTINRSKTSENKETIAVGGIEIKNTHSIDIDYSLPLIQLDFEWYIGYSILNESYTVSDEYEEFEGESFRVYSKSRYLNFIKLGSIASEEYPGPFHHYEIACLNHIIDIVSTEEPIIKEVKR